MSLIEWTISIKPPVKKTDNDTSMEESLQLFRYNSFVSCKFVCSLSLRYWKPGKNKAFLRLRWMGKPNGLETEDSPEFHHLPCNIAVCVDGKKRQPLKPVYGFWRMALGNRTHTNSSLVTTKIAYTKNSSDIHLLNQVRTNFFARREDCLKIADRFVRSSS